MSATVTSLSETYTATFGRYGDAGRLYIGFDTDQGDHWCDLTVNFPRVELGEREVVIDANSPDPALAEAVEKAGLVTFTKRTVASGFLIYHVAELSEAFYALAVREAGL